MKRLLEAMRPLFGKDRPLAPLTPVFNAFESFLYSAQLPTDTPPYGRDPIDLKRVMTLVVVADQKKPTDQNRQRRGFTGTSRYASQEEVESRSVVSRLAEHKRCCRRHRIGNRARSKVGQTSPHPGTGLNPIARHRLRISKGKENPAHEGGVEKVAAGSAEDLLPDEHSEGDPDGYHPQGKAGWYDKREEEAGNEESFTHLFLANYRLS